MTTIPGRVFADRFVTTGAGADAVDPSRWPDVATTPYHPVRAAVAQRLFRGAVAKLPIRVWLPGGEMLGRGDADAPAMQLVRPDAFYQRVGATGLIGFGEAYMAGDWIARERPNHHADADSTDIAIEDDLASVLSEFAQHMSTLIPPWLQRLRQATMVRAPGAQDNTMPGSRANISHHYDLSNELFSLFLDPSMMYSSALFEGDPGATSESLRDAEHRKVDRLLDAAGVTYGTRVLEIGTGWGELAILAADRGAHVTTITLSAEQAELARKRIENAGHSDRVEVLLQDYREVTGTFDAIVSIEMIEAVGANHWPEYFQALHDRLGPNGRIGLQAITMPHDRMVASMNTYTWILKYIFPGGQIASVQAVGQQARAAGLRVIGNYAFGLHYAETLRRWRATFEAEADTVDRLGFDLVFRRMWSLYLAYSEAGFRSGYLDVNQFVLSK
jgi:cyclopropane-fatty-acyl-phospholipid synthase